jgi:glycosyltransferase involved in cell wall biosynthesis
MGIPFVAHAHGADASSRLREPEWKRRYAVLEKATAIVTVSHAMKRALEAAGIGVGKIHVIPCGVNIAETPPAPRPHRPFSCLAVGRMTGKKAPIHLLEAFRRALARMEGARLEFVGDGPLLSAVHEFVKVASLQDSVRLLGERSNDEVLRLMRDADAFVQHSLVDPLNGDAEGLPASILEAMADGLPVVSTLHAGIPEAVEDGVTGFLVPEGDIQGMADRFVDLARDPDLRRTMGQSGWSRVRRMFSWELEKEKLLDVLGLRQAAPELPAVLTRT